IEFFPEEGKYHADGHRACGVNWLPEQTRAAGGRCSECGRPVTVGVLSRVEELADRPVGAPPPAGAKRVSHLVPLPEVLGEIHRVGPRSKTVTVRVDELVAALGTELEILTQVPLDDIQRAGGELLAEAVRRLRAGEVHRVPGYDGEYGVIRLFEPSELARPAAGADALCDLPVARRPRRPVERKAASRPPAPRRQEAPPLAPEVPLPSPHEPFEPMLAGMEEVGTGLLDRLDAMQRVAAAAPGGP